MDECGDAGGSASAARELLAAAWDEAAALAVDSSGAGDLRFIGAASITADSFPGYELICEAHRGGQGVVFHALQKSTRRHVAIKAVREGFFGDTRDQARFEREVHILGLLKDPHIVTIHDSGRAAGYWFFVTDYVDGRPLDVYARDLGIQQEGGYPVGDLLQVFVKVCDAVNAAHLRGIIHRDLKPGNVLVDARGEPFVLDFGLAKWAEGTVDRASSDLSLTQTGQFVGSLPWASPEQAVGDAAAVSLRSDVYSLGVLLYQVLTDRFPYPVIGNVQTIVGHICGTEPARPRRFSDRVDEELEIIILKALAKEPERRYETAGDLARDLRRYLAREPILARPPSTFYQLRKFIQRKRPLVAGVLVAILAVVAGIVATAWQAVAATRARNEARVAARIAAQKQQEAERAARTSDHVRAFLNDMLVSANPDAAAGRDTAILRDILDRAARRVEEELKEEPEVAAEVRRSIANTYLSMGLYPQAAEHWAAVVEFHRQNEEQESSAFASALSKLALARYYQEQFVEAEALARESLAVKRRIVGEEHRDVAHGLNVIGEILYAASRTAGAPDRVQALLSESAEVLGQSLAIYRKVATPDDMEMARTLMNIGNVHSVRKELDGAERGYDEALEILRRQATPQPRAMATVLFNLAYLKNARGQATEAEKLMLEALETYRSQLGPEHPSVAVAAQALARMMHGHGNPAAATAHYREAVAIRRKSGNRGMLADSLHGLGMLLYEQREFDESLSHLQEALALYGEEYGAEHPFVGRASGNLGRLLKDRGEFEEAEQALKDSAAILEKALGTAHPDVAMTRARLVELYEAWGRPEEANTWRAAPPEAQNTSAPVE